jgi:hypothetical protein
MRAKYVPIQKWHFRERSVENRYVLVFCPEHPKAFRGGWYYEHRLVAEKQFGRVLQSWETVHHISGDRTDNSWENLFVCTRQEHDKAA